MSTTMSDKAVPAQPRTRAGAPAPLSRQRNRAALLFLLPRRPAVCDLRGLADHQHHPLSFYNWDGMTTAGFRRTRQLRRIVPCDTFYTALKNNLIWLCCFCWRRPWGCRRAVSEPGGAGIRIVKSLFFAPFVLSGVVVGLMFGWFYDPTFGLLKLILGHGVPVLGDPRYVTLGIIFAALWPQTAYCMILYLTGLTGMNSRVDRSGAHGRRARLVDAVARDPAATAAHHVHGDRGDGDRRAAQLRSDLGDDRRRSVRKLDRARVLHVRPGDQVLPR